MAGSVGPLAESLLGLRTEPRTAARNPGSRAMATRSGTVLASVNRRLKLEHALVERGALGQGEGPVEGPRHHQRVDGGALVGGLVDEALGVVPARRRGVDLRAGAEALDDHRHAGGQRQLDEQLLVVGLQAADGPLGQVGDGAARWPGRRR